MPWGGHSPKDSTIVFSPGSGPAAGGTTVTITDPAGQVDFHGTTGMNINGVPCTSVHVKPDSVTGVSPAGTGTNLGVFITDGVSQAGASGPGGTNWSYT